MDMPILPHTPNGFEGTERESASQDRLNRGLSLTVLAAFGTIIGWAVMYDTPREVPLGQAFKDCMAETGLDKDIVNELEARRSLTRPDGQIHHGETVYVPERPDGRSLIVRFPHPSASQATIDSAHVLIPALKKCWNTLGFGTR